MAGNTDGVDPLDWIEEVERALLGSKRSFTRKEVAEKAGVPLEVAQELWQQLGFPRTADDDVAFTKEDLKALQRTNDLISLGILTPDSQSAMVRTWGRSFARLAEWQVNLLAEIAIAGEHPQERLSELMDTVLPRVEKLQSYVWRRHLEGAASRRLAQVADEGPGTTSTMAVGFVDIVGYTGQSKTMSDSDLVHWVEYFENEMTRTVVDLGGRVIKTIGDEVLFVSEDPVAAAEVTLIVTERGEDDDDEFPRVRAGVAYGEVVSRLGDVYGPTVNIAARLTSVARPGSVLVDRGAHEVLSGPIAEDAVDTVEMPTADESLGLSKILDRAAEELAQISPYTQAGDYRLRRLPRKSVKGYSKLEPWLLRRSKEARSQESTKERD
ncbi:MAG TPA: adenylate/guanylate cyclase domain-containing protein [Nocardioides sp.]|nr:adenylate/guanylate cyclase domain-containing protein [Nocardioides sp.]